MVGKGEKISGLEPYNIKDSYGNMPNVNFQINLTQKQKEAYSILHDKDTQFLIARWSRQC